MDPDLKETDFEDYAMDPTVSTAQPASSSAKSATTSTCPASPTAQSAASPLHPCKKRDWLPNRLLFKKSYNLYLSRQDSDSAVF